MRYALFVILVDLNDFGTEELVDFGVSFYKNLGFLIYNVCEIVG